MTFILAADQKELADPEVRFFRPQSSSPETLRVVGRAENFQIINLHQIGSKPEISSESSDEPGCERSGSGKFDLS
jgi:hypothetical protein